MPVAWIKKWGKGRVFYSALGHSPEEFSKFPASLELTVRGLLWAAGEL
jgi:type 1 glutamine amidotransferase